MHYLAMFLRIISIILLFFFINNSSYGYHLYKGVLKSDLPSCGPKLVEGWSSMHFNINVNGCHGEVSWRKGNLYKGEFKLHEGKLYLHGKGTFFYSNGYKAVGMYEYNKFVFGALYKDGKFIHGGKFSDKKLVKSMPTPYSPEGSSVSQASLSPLKKSFQSLNSYRRKKIQESLSSEGLYNSTIDGLYGRGTEKALKEYNKKYLSNSDLKKKDNVSTLLAKLQEVEARTPKVVSKKVEEKKEVVETTTDTKKINKEWQLLAEEGSAMAQYKLASMYEQGEGLLKDFVYAHMWANLSATNGYAEAKDLRDALEKKMTASQMEKAQDLARECMKKKYKGC